MIRYWTTPYSILESMEATLEYAIIKEGCKRGHGLSAAIKLSRKSGENCWSFSYYTLVCTEQPFFVEKTTLHNLLPL